MSYEEEKENEEIKCHHFFPDIKITESILLNSLSNALNDIIWNTVKYDSEPEVKIVIKNELNQYEILSFNEKSESLMTIRSNINQYMKEEIKKEEEKEKERVEENVVKEGDMEEEEDVEKNKVEEVREEEKKEEMMEEKKEEEKVEKEEKDEKEKGKDVVEEEKKEVSEDDKKENDKIEEEEERDNNNTSENSGNDNSIQAIPPLPPSPPPPPPPPSTIASSATNISINNNDDDIGGVLLFIYSVILSRGIERVKDDKVYDDEPLIVMFGNTSADLMNLLLVGYATQFLHDGIKNQDGLIFKGIISQPDIGILSIHEAFGFQQNGLYLKYPLYPIWIILGETHISVMFNDKIETSQLSKEEVIWNRILYKFKELDITGSECVDLADFSKLTDLIEPPLSNEIVIKCQDLLRNKCEGVMIPFRDIEMLLKPYVYKVVNSIDENIKNYFYYEPEVIQSTNVQGNNNNNNNCWNCSSCTYRNKASDSFCEMCNSAKPTAFYVWKCRFCSTENNESDEICSYCKENKHTPLQQYNFTDPEFVINLFNIYYYSTVIPISGCRQPIYKAEISRKDPLLRFGKERGINGVIRTKWNECEIKWDNIDGYPDIER